jgi:uncharacterized protein
MAVSPQSVLEKVIMLPSNAPRRNCASPQAHENQRFKLFVFPPLTLMKLQQSKIFDAYNITHYGEGYILVNRERRFESGVVVMPQALLEDWGTQGFEGLSQADMARLKDAGAEIVLLGTGPRQRFPHPSLLRPLIEAKIGFEVMDSAAACRTYNILMSEGRKVAAAILFK